MVPLHKTTQILQKLILCLVTVRLLLAKPLLTMEVEEADSIVDLAAADLAAAEVHLILNN